MSKEIEEKSILIAQFDGYEIISNNIPEFPFVRVKRSEALVHPAELKYCSSWDWQVLVWSKLTKQALELIEGLEAEESNRQFISFFRMKAKYHKAVDVDDKQAAFEILFTVLNWFIRIKDATTNKSASSQSSPDKP